VDVQHHYGSSKEKGYLMSLCLCLFSDVFKKQVGFHAVLVTGEVITLKKDEIVKCDYVVYNAGGGYDNKIGVFTVPASGVYCFMAMSTPLSEDLNVSCWAQNLIG
jgi:hypothetical protein